MYYMSEFIIYLRSHKCVWLHTGGNLGDVISENRKKRTGLGISDLAQILMQVSQGLKYIHAQGLVHLDIKPGKSALSPASYVVL